MTGRCDSCRKFKVGLKTQTNFGVTRNMCAECCEAADKCERMMAPAHFKTPAMRLDILNKLPKA